MAATTRIIQIALVGLLCIEVHAMAAQPADAVLIQLCQDELKSRQPAGEVQSNTELVGSHIEQNDSRAIVDIQVTEAEGRRVTGRCIIRNGKVFDFKD